MADGGRQKWSGETGAWVDDIEEELKSFEPVDAHPEQKPHSSRASRSSTRGLDSVTMQRLPQVALVLLGAGIVAAAIFAVLMLIKPSSASIPFQDLGPGVSDVAGLKGHMVTRWQKDVQYELKFEPLFAIYNSGFAYTVGHPPAALWINLRLLDSTGYALCSKQIAFRAGPVRTNVDLALLHQPAVRKVNVSATSPPATGSGGHAQLQAGQSPDTFQNVIDDDGQISSVYVQGVLPCTEAQYKKFNYWDFTTNFPSVEQQDTLMKAPAIAKARAAAAARAAQKEREARSPHYFVEGDTSVRAYDPTTATLEGGSGQSFIVVKKAELPTAYSWAQNNAQIHYKCDTLSNCMLTRAGDGRIVETRSIP